MTIDRQQQGKQKGEERIRWLLQFLQRDVESMRLGELFDLRNDIFPYLHEDAGHIVTDFSAEDLLASGPFPPSREGVDPQEVIAAARDYLSGLQQDLREGVARFERLGQWAPFARDQDNYQDQQAPGWLFERAEDGTTRRTYMGSPRVITLAAAADLIIGWWPDLRRCSYGPCGALFLPRHGRQHYHDPVCSAAQRQARHKPKRDHQAEYAKKVRREIGPNVKPDRRAPGKRSGG